MLRNSDIPRYRTTSEFIKTLDPQPRESSYQGNVQARTAKVQEKCIRDKVKPHGPIASLGAAMPADREDEHEEDFRKQAEEGEGVY